MKNRWLVVLATLVSLAVARPALADNPLVVLVGIDKYDDAQIKPHENAEADAKALYAHFASKDHLAADENRMKLLLGTPDPKYPRSEPATRENLLNAIKWLEQTATKDDTVIFGFFGSGAPMGERTVYLTTDSTFKDRDKNAVAAADMEHIFDKLKSQHFIALVDCNFMGFDAGMEKVSSPSLNKMYREFEGSDEDAKADPAPNRIVFLANNGLKPTLHVDDHGAFTKILLEGLNGKADIEGYEADGNITIGELIKFVNAELPKLVRKIGKNDEEKVQLPIVFPLAPNDDFIVEHNPEAYARAKERLTKFDKVAADAKLEKNVIEEGEGLLTRMPTLKALQELRKTYQKLADGKLETTAFLKERSGIRDTMVLSERDAKNFATTVMRAAKVVRQDYFKDVPSGTLVASAITGLFRSVSEKVPSTIKGKLDKTKGMTDAELTGLLVEAREHLGKREDLESDKDVTYSLHGMMGTLDRHTDYIDPDTWGKLNRDIGGRFTGVGIQITTNALKDMLEVVTPIRNSPAYKAKIFAGDIITKIIREVDDKGRPLAQPEVTSTKGLTSDEAVKKILGVEGTKVKLVVEREGDAQPLEFELIRGSVEVESILGAKRNPDDSWNYVIDPENKICYVRMTQFSENTARDLSDVMKKLSKTGIKGFILDLRFNPGGLLDKAVSICDLFIDDGLIVTIKPRNGPEQSYVGHSDGSFTAFPMVCLVNGQSASASEIVSACLQDHGRAIVIGSRSYGKGSVQTIHSFDKQSSIKLTTATFWRPSGKNLNRSTDPPSKEEDDWGVKPNPGFELKVEGKELYDLSVHLRNLEIIAHPPRPGDAPPPESKFRDRQLEMALDYLRSQITAAPATKTASKQAR